MSSILSPIARPSRVILSFSCRPPAIHCNSNPASCFRVWPQQRRWRQKGIAWLSAIRAVPAGPAHTHDQNEAACRHAVRVTRRCVTVCSASKSGVRVHLSNLRRRSCRTPRPSVAFPVEQHPKRRKPDVALYSPHMQMAGYLFASGDSGIPRVVSRQTETRLLACPSPHTVCHVQHDCPAGELTWCSIRPARSPFITSIFLAERMPTFFNLHCAPMILSM